MRFLSTTVLWTVLVGSVALGGQVIPPTVPPGARLQWDHMRANTASFEVRVDAGAWVSVGLPATNEWTVPALTAGNHDLSVRACNSSGCSTGAVLGVQMILVPAVPSGLRLAPALINQTRAPRGAPLAPVIK